MGLSLPEKIRIRALVEDRLQAPLLALHAATEVAALGKAADALLRAAFEPVSRVTLFLGHFGMGEARLVLTEPPIPDVVDWYTERGRLNPFSPWIAGHVGAPSYRFSSVLPAPGRFRRTEFYRRFARLEGWDDGMSGLGWEGEEVTAMFSVYRAPRTPRFTERDERLLLYLRPYVLTAIGRVRKLHEERLYRRALEEFNRDLPVGLLILDWEGRLVFATAEAYRLAAVWNHGPEAPRMFNVRDTWALPGPLETVLRDLRAAALGLNPKDTTGLAALRRDAVEPDEGRVRASVRLLQDPGGALAPPGFLVALEPGRRAPAGVDPLRVPLLAGLTPGERAVALAVAEGLTNQEVADSLGRSILTVKTQLNRVFGKLGVRSRTRLVALLRPGG